MHAAPGPGYGCALAMWVMLAFWAAVAAFGLWLWL